MNTFNEIKGKFAFGCMRLPLDNGKIDRKKFSQMADTFLSGGYNYFDTAKGYHSGDSEKALCDCVTKNYPRSSFLIADKLSNNYFSNQGDIAPLFSNQLSTVGVDYFDFYLFHALNADYYEKYKACRAFEFVAQKIKEGKIRRFGISFHDSAKVLDNILSEQKSIEFVQLQLNYADFHDPVIQSEKCLEVCKKHNTPVFVMEPVKGGLLTKLPPSAMAEVEKTGLSSAELALRFAGTQEGVKLTLSGASTLAQLKENMRIFNGDLMLSPKMEQAINRINSLLSSQESIGCTACRYCVDGCPKNISIPDLFACMNQKSVFKDWNSEWYYMVRTQANGKAGDCISCGSCVKVCPQKLNIPFLLKRVSDIFDKSDTNIHD